MPGRRRSWFKRLQDFKAQMQVVCDGEMANARSILGLLSLAAGYGSKLTFTASGPDAASAMEAGAAAVRLEFRRGLLSLQRLGHIGKPNALKRPPHGFRLAGGFEFLQDVRGIQ